MTGAVEQHDFASGAALAGALADRVAGRLSQALAARGRALLAVSGGTTPVRFFDALSRRTLDWPHVTVTLADERFVPLSSPRSNAGLVARHLLRNEAARAAFVGLNDGTGTVEEAAARAGRAIAALPLPLDVAVLGMGADGHTASFFPDAEDASGILAGDGPPVLAVRAPGVPEPRLMLSLPILAGARFLALHIEGARKKAVFGAAMRERAGRPLPVRALIDRAASPIQVFWAPEDGAAD